MMMTTNEVTKVFEAILSSPGMHDTVRVDLRISRCNILLLNQVLQRGLLEKPDDEALPLLANTPKENLDELKAFAGSCLEKAGLTELSEKITELHRNAKH